MKGTNSMYDIIIIGSGPAGLSAAIYAKRANLNVAVAEKEYEGTGQIAESGNWYHFPSTSAGLYLLANSISFKSVYNLFYRE